MPEILSVPYLGTAEEDVVLASWLVAEGASFHRGEAIAVVETLKASFEVEAERDGVLLRRLVDEGQRVRLQAPLGVIGDAGESVDDTVVGSLLAEAVPGVEDTEDIAPSEPAAPVGTGDVFVRAAPAARARATELGVDLGSVTGSGPGGMIRVEDVGSASLGDGRVDPALLGTIDADPEAFVARPSDEKLELYRRHGARIGTGIVLGDRMWLRAERLVLGDDVRFGDGCHLDCVEFVAGTGTEFGPRCRIRGRRITLGNNAFFVSDVEIGGGGAMDPEAELQIGSHGFVGEHAHLNVCRKLVIGDEVVISRSAVIMTHSFGGNVLAGYPSRFAGVTIEDGCQVGIYAVLFPGVTMGRGSILLSGSSLVTAVPPGRLYGGVPAEDLKSATADLGDSERKAIALALVDEFARQLELRGFEVGVIGEDEGRTVEVVHGGNRHVLRYAHTLPGGEAELCAEDVRVGLDVQAWDELDIELIGIDLLGRRIRGPLGPLASAFREFLRKRGVRLEPRTWTYRGGWL